jgi:hypothetical protein
MTDIHDLLRRALGGVAPSPDALEATIQRIHRRRRRRRVLVTGVTLAVFAGAGLVVTWVAGDLGVRLATPAPTTATPSTAPSTVPPSAAGLVPRTIREGNRTVLPVTFPDGSTAELVYPRALALAGMGVQPDVSFLRVRDPGPRFELVFSRGGPTPGLLKGDRPVGRYQTAQGRPVQLWPAVENPGVVSASYGYWLHYRIGAWTVLAGVGDRAMAAEVARNLDGRQTGDGFVVVQASGPFALSREYGEGRGAQLAIGDHSPLPSAIVAEPWRLIELSPARGSCQQEGVSGEHGSKCLGPGGAGIFANISGDPLWVKAVVKGLEAKNVHLAP